MFSGRRGLDMLPEVWARVVVVVPKEALFTALVASSTLFLESVASLSTGKGSICFFQFSVLLCHSFPSKDVEHWGQAAGKNTLPFPCQLKKKAWEEHWESVWPAAHSRLAEPTHSFPQRCPHGEQGTLRPPGFSLAQKGARFCLIGGPRFPEDWGGTPDFMFQSILFCVIIFHGNPVCGGEKKRPQE